MKTIPTIHTATTSPVEITRTAAAYHLRRERGEGKIINIRGASGYILTSQGMCLLCPRVKKPVPVEPPRPFALSVLLTHKYVPGWDHLDKRHDLGSAIDLRVKAAKWDDHGESCRQFLVLDVDAPRYRPRNIMRAIRDTMRRGCRCEHDCCGHIQSSVSRTRHLGGSRYAVVISGCRNI